MSGGSATNAGIAFQNEVAAFIAVHILADVPIAEFDLPSGVKPTSLEMETSAPVDDILVRTSAGGFCFINVKRSVSASELSTSPLGSVIDQFVRQWIACKSGQSQRSWQRPLDPSRDRLVLLTAGIRSTSFVNASSRVLERICSRQGTVRKPA